MVKLGASCCFCNYKNNKNKRDFDSSRMCRLNIPMSVDFYVAIFDLSPYFGLSNDLLYSRQPLVFSKRHNFP